MGRTIDCPSNGGRAPGWLAGEGNATGVVVIQEWWGLNEQIKGTAERLAGEGFVALVPDLYHGKVTKSPDEAGKLLMAMNIAETEKDLRGAVAHLRRLTGKPVGVVGFCMGGALSLYAACTNGVDVGACVVYYGGHPKVSWDFDGLKAPVLGHWAEDDDWANANVPIIRKGLDERGKPYEFHTYPGTKHAFFNEERPDVHVRDAADTSFERTVEFFRKHL
jgi:carboxymethylenebutenolidase